MQHQMAARQRARLLLIALAVGADEGKRERIGERQAQLMAIGRIDEQSRHAGCGSIAARQSEAVKACPGSAP